MAKFPTSMKNLFTLFALLISAMAFSQRANDQYSIEAGYGLSLSGQPSILGYSHFEVGFRYMVDDLWGLKFDYGSDKFRTNETPENGSDYSRFSVQGVHNLGRTLNFRDVTNNRLSLLAHGGLGYSSLKSVTLKGTDKIGNVIIGLTPQVRIVDNLALRADASVIFNFTQHFNFEGTYDDTGNGPKNAFTGNLFNFSLGLTYYFGKNGSNSDWR